jgi:large subunit ribosomal protein L4
MPKVKVYNQEGKVTGEQELSAKVFGVAAIPTVVHEVMVGLRANSRHPWAHTKTRGNVRGGGKKPWKQKGTGRARQGSIRSPQWVGGGIAFGPLSERDYTKKINRKQKEKALLMVLSDKAANERLLLVEGLGSKDGKTKVFATMMGKLPVKGTSTVVVSGREELLARATRNLQDVRLVTTSSLGLVDILSSDYLIMTPDAAKKIEAAHVKKA